jgi:hypothetical protein
MFYFVDVSMDITDGLKDSPDLFFRSLGYYLLFFRQGT